jgi:hypothetical protein
MEWTEDPFAEEASSSTAAGSQLSLAISSPATSQSSPRTKGSGALNSALSQGPRIQLTPEEKRRTRQAEVTQAWLDVFTNDTKLNREAAWAWNQTNCKWASRYADRKTYPDELLRSELAKLARLIRELELFLLSPPDDVPKEELQALAIKLCRRRGRQHATLLALDMRAKADQLPSRSVVTNALTVPVLGTGSCETYSRGTSGPRRAGTSNTSRKGLIG